MLSVVAPYLDACHPLLGWILLKKLLFTLCCLGSVTDHPRPFSNPAVMGVEVLARIQGRFRSKAVDIVVGKGGGNLAKK